MVPATGTRVLTTACAAFVAVPNLGALLGRGEQTDRFDTSVTPPDYAFAIWGPIFTACAIDVVRRWRDPGSPAPSDAATEGPLAAAYVLNTAWSVAAQADRFALTPMLLPVATACTAVAHDRLQRVDDPRRSTVLATGLLLGWTTLASAVNVTAEVVRRGAPADGMRATRVGRSALLLAGGAVAATVGTSRHGRLPVAAAAGWGLMTTAGDRSRRRSTRVLAAALAAGVGTAAVVRPAH